MAICSICGAANPTDETHCAICGARLQRGLADAPEEDVPSRFYSSAMGEDDLMAARASGGLLFGFALFVLGMGVAAALFFGLSQLGGDDPMSLTTPSVQAQTVRTDSPFYITSTSSGGASGLATLTPNSISEPPAAPSNTRTPPPPLPTVTDVVEITPTSDACTVTVAEGDTLYGLALQCGHRDLAVVQQIIEQNSLRCETCLQIGQIIEVPRPTPTLTNDTGAAVPAEEVAAAPEEASDVMVEGQELSAEDHIATRQVIAEPTLDPNLMYHTITQGQTLFDVVAIYGVDVKLLSEINPEIEFPQCDFGERFGGPTCSVFFIEGQQIRVPAPTPTPTIPPTASGSETPTPTATATINVPAAFAPADEASFDAATIVTLRWTTSGTLAQDEVYAVHVENTESGDAFDAITCDQAFDIPMNWRATEAGFYEFEWTVSVVSVRNGEGDSYTVRSDGLDQCALSFVPEVEWITMINDLPDVGRVDQIALGDARYQTETRRFFWQGLN